MSLVLLLSVECRPYISLDKSTMEDPYSGKPISSEKCWWRVSSEWANTTTVMTEHANQVENVLSLYSMCLINEHYKGYL